MGKLIYNLNVSLDRFIETPDHSLDWSAARSVQLDHPDEPGPETPDIERHRQWVRDGRWAAWIRNDAGDVSDWHHHADNEPA